MERKSKLHRVQLQPWAFSLGRCWSANRVDAPRPGHWLGPARHLRARGRAARHPPRRGAPPDAGGPRRRAAVGDGHRGGHRRAEGPPPRHVRDDGRGRSAPRRRRHRLRRGVDHQGVHLPAAGGHGPPRRGVAGRPGEPVPPGRREAAVARRPADHPGRPGDAHLRPPAAAHQPPVGQPGEQVRRLHREPDVPVPLGAGRERRPGDGVRLLEPGLWPPRARPLPAGRGRVPGAAAHPRHRAARPRRHPVRSHPRDAGAARHRPHRRPGSGASLGLR